MSTMIERMARAMWGWEMQTQMFRMFDDESDNTKRMFRSRARAALTALLEPNPAWLWSENEVFRNAIQAALDEKEGV